MVNVFQSLNVDERRYPDLAEDWMKAVASGSLAAHPIPRYHVPIQNVVIDAGQMKASPKNKSSFLYTISRDSTVR